MNKSKIDKKKLMIICIIFALFGLAADIIGFLGKDNLILKKNKSGEGQKIVHVKIDADGVVKNYDYDIKIRESLITAKQAAKFLKQAKKEINSQIFAKGDNVNHVTKKLQLKEKWADGMVAAEWYFDRYDVITPAGKPIFNKISKKGSKVNLHINLICGQYSDKTTLKMILYRKKLSKKENLIYELDSKIANNQINSQTQYFSLPQRIDGVEVKWKKKSKFYFVKILFFSFIVMILLKLSELEEMKNKEKMRQMQLRIDYSQIVSKFVILIGAGMSISSCLHRIAENAKNNNEELGNKEGYKQLIITSNEIKDGISDRIAIQKLAERVKIPEYRRFSRLLIQNMQKGSTSLAKSLEEEMYKSFEIRKNLAKKLGEEASTKLLGPMMIMFGIVMAVVIAPAIFTFHI
ncbi:type II secretion system F family protein [Lachnobacterium bovis]|uniref:type II secretion system F family protein n=1 Tax=Lachnobacterium bovis TaxID=140626 RepID=UPI0003B55F57|nr:type II secretion system F family protein [Lachnobacterium bovis]